MADSGLIIPLAINAELGIDFLRSDNGPDVDHPDAPLSCRAYKPATGDWFTKKTAGWVEDGDSSFTQTVADGLYVRLATASTMTARLDNVGAESTDIVYQAYTSGNDIARYKIDASGQLLWSDGTDSSDTNLYRGAASSLWTDGAMRIKGSGGLTVDHDLSVAGGVFAGTNPATVGAFGMPNDVALCARNAANSGNVDLIYLDASNKVNIGDSSAAGVIAAKAIVAPDFVLA